MLDMKKIEEISAGVDGHLRKLESFVGVLREMKLSLDMLRESQESTLRYEVARQSRTIESLVKQLQKMGVPQISDYEQRLSEIKDLLESKEWPKAVENEQLCETEDRARLRANNILEMLVSERLKGKKFLDFGCGQGHTVEAAIQNGAEFALGYDVDLSQCKLPKQQFTDSFETVKSHAPYDIVLIYDVLDHIVQVDPIAALKQAASVLKTSGRIYLCTHPWSSRHGGHLYQQKNCAFLHLVLDEVEATRLYGLQSTHNIKVVKPLETYRYWFQQAGLNVKSEWVQTSDVEDFFLTPSVVRDRLTRHWEDENTMLSHMKIDFVEYSLELAEQASNLQIF